MTSFRLTCSSSWISEKKLNKDLLELIPAYWASYSKLHDIIKVEDTTDDVEEKGRLTGTSTNHVIFDTIKIEDDVIDSHSVTQSPSPTKTKLLLKHADVNIYSTIKTSKSSRIKEVITKASHYKENVHYDNDCARDVVENNEPIINQVENNVIEIVESLSGPKYLADQARKKKKKKKKYQCFRCKIVFDSVEGYDLHVNSPLPCVDLSNPITESESGQNRGEVVTRPKEKRSPCVEITCDICDLYFTTTKDLEHHKILHSIESRRHREVTELLVEEEAELEKLKVLYNKDRPFVCPLCCRGFEEVDVLQAHISVHYLATFACQICSDVFVRESALLEHILTHRRMGPSSPTTTTTTTSVQGKSSILNESGSTTLNLQGQKSILNESASTNLNVQGKSSILNESGSTNLNVQGKSSILNESGSTNLNVQGQGSILNEPGSTNLNYNCFTCGKVFSHRYYLQNHEKVHRNPKPFLCRQCSQRFKTNSELEQHKIDFHSNIIKFDCDRCSKSFLSKNSLIVHRKTHGNNLDDFALYNEAPTSNNTTSNNIIITPGTEPSVSFKCFKCDERFHTLEPLMKHEETYHRKVKKFKCVLCLKKYAKHCDLRRHMMSHTGERPYKCETCGRAFTRNSHLKAHKLTHTGVRPYMCLICDKGFVKRADLKKHLLTHTTVIPVV